MLDEQQRQLMTSPSRILTGVLLASLTVCVLACGVSSGGDCEAALTQSETSNGTFTYDVSGSDAGGPATVRGDLGAASALSVAARMLPDEGGDGDGAPSPDPTSIVVSGTFTDDAGDAQSFYLLIDGVPSSGRASLGRSSVACLDDVASCTPLTGTIATTTFAEDCRGEAGCALTIAGSLKATTAWTGGSFAVEIALGHEDVWAPSSTCE